MLNKKSSWKYIFNTCLNFDKKCRVLYRDHCNVVRNNHITLRIHVTWFTENGESRVHFYLLFDNGFEKKIGKLFLTKYIKLIKKGSLEST